MAVFTNPVPVRALPAVATLLLAMAGSAAHAFNTFLHLQGEEGNREAYFSAISASDRTSKEDLLGPISVKQITVHAVYENASRPEWVVMQLQFECPNAWGSLDGKRTVSVKPGEAVRFRIGAGSHLVRRVDLQAQPLPESEWKASSAPMLVKAARIACNEHALDAAVRRAIKNPQPGSSYDEVGWGRDMEKLGLPPDLMLIGYVQPSEQANFCWDFLWERKRRPDPSGLWSRVPTDAERAEAQRKLQALHDQSAPLLAAAQTTLESNIRRMRADIDFRDRAAEFRKGRSLNKFETNLVAVWVGRHEDEVVAKLGVPRVVELTNVRTLSYARERDNRRVVVNAANGAAWEEGVYSRCSMDFLTILDGQGAWRVADVRVALDSNAFDKSTCHDLSKLPN